MLHSRNLFLWKQWYTSLVEHHLDFASSASDPYLVYNIKTPEKVQDGDSRIIFGIKSQVTTLWRLKNGTFHSWKRENREET